MKRLLLESNMVGIIMAIVVGVIVEIIEIICYAIYKYYIFKSTVPVYATCIPGTGGAYLCSLPIGNVEWN